MNFPHGPGHTRHTVKRPVQILISAKSAPCSFRLTPASSITPRPMPEKTDLLLRLGHSPDPDDAFMFYGLAKNKLPTGRYRFEHILQDIQTLNHRAMHG